MRRQRLSRNRMWIIVSLLAIAVAGLFAPRSWTGQLMNLTQILVPFQDAATATIDVAAGAIDGNAGSPLGEEYARLERENEALRHQVAGMSLRIAEVEQENAILTGVRLQDLDGTSIGIQGRLVPARVVTGDILSWRSSHLIDAGSLRGVKAGAPVTSREFSVDVGSQDGVQNGMAVLLAEAFIGSVENTGTHTARVKLLTDVSTRLRVRIGRFEDDLFFVKDADYLLTGCADGKMRVRDVDRREIDAGSFAVGDVVLVDPSQGIAPAALTVGKITGIEPDRENPLLAILTVESPVDLGSIRRVYVYDPNNSTD